MNSESYVNIDIEDALYYIQNKRRKVEKHQEGIIEKHIQMNIKPAKKGWFKDKPEVTYEHVVRELDEFMIDDMFGQVTWRHYLTRRTYSQLKRLAILEQMCEDSCDGGIILCRTDYEFVKLNSTN